jgi:hypothetical protein
MAGLLSFLGLCAQTGSIVRDNDRHLDRKPAKPHHENVPNLNPRLERLPDRSH